MVEREGNLQAPCSHWSMFVTVTPGVHVSGHQAGAREAIGKSRVSSKRRMLGGEVPLGISKSHLKDGEQQSQCAPQSERV